MGGRWFLNNFFTTIILMDECLGNGCQMVITLGLHIGFGAAHKYSMVFNYEFANHCAIPHRNG